MRKKQKTGWELKGYMILVIGFLILMASVPFGFSLLLSIVGGLLVGAMVSRREDAIFVCVLMAFAISAIYDYVNLVQGQSFLLNVIKDGFAMFIFSVVYLLGTNIGDTHDRSEYYHRFRNL